MYSKKQNDEWNEIVKLFANDGFQDELFGYSVDVHNDKIVTGAYLKQSNAFNIGEVYVYKNEKQPMGA